jgi:DNA-binding LacI/PurR family transcriptional regulator
MLASRSSEGRAIDDLLAYRCEAVIVVGPTMRTQDLVALSKQLPTVVLARRVPGGAVDVVRTDDIDALAKQPTTSLSKGTTESCTSTAGVHPERLSAAEDTARPWWPLG